MQTKGWFGSGFNTFLNQTDKEESADVNNTL